MQVDDHTIQDILGDGRRFMVPIYQRKYEWDDSDLLRFWEDVEAKAMEILEGESKFRHYMGALILAPTGMDSPIGETPKVYIVDGQQRMTTFLLFLSALREVSRKFECDDVEKQINDYLYNKLKSKDTDKLAKYKLTPTHSDQKVFHHIMDESHEQVRSRYNKIYWGGRVAKSKTKWRSLRAYEELYRLIDDFVRLGSAEMKEDDEKYITLDSISDETDTEEAKKFRLEALLEALLNKMKLVVITLEEDDDAQVIFESLNSKGKPLYAMDLVRNNIFYRAEKEQSDVKELYRELWEPFDDPWWRENAPFARPKRHRIDHFLTHVLAAETGQKISMRELYAEYKSFAIQNQKPRFNNTKDELRLLEKYSPLYQTLEGHINVDEDLHWLGRKLAAWQLTTAFPVAMKVCMSDIDKSEKRTIYNLVYSYIVRRALSGLTSKNFNLIFQSLSQDILNNGASVENFYRFFSERAGDSVKYPNDSEFRRGILSKPAYLLAQQTRIKDVLWEIEVASRTRYAVKMDMPEDMWTEHVLPVAWTKEWPFEKGMYAEPYSDDPNAITRSELLHTLGNLTLLTSGLNRSSSNRSFAKKKNLLKKHDTLFINKMILSKNVWNESIIKKRSETLAKMAVKIWPGINYER